FSTEGMRRVGYLTFVLVGLATCTSLEGLSGPTDAGDAGNDAAAPEGGEDAGDAGSEAGPCDDVGLVAFWRFDEGAGTLVGDCTKYKNDGQLTAGAWVPGVRGTAIDLDGGWVSAKNPAAFQIVGEMTAAAFVRVVGSVDAGSSYVVGKSNDI